MTAGAGRARDKKFFVRVSECPPYACESEMSKKLYAMLQQTCGTRVYQHSPVVTGGETRD